MKMSVWDKEEEEDGEEEEGREEWVGEKYLYLRKTSRLGNGQHARKNFPLEARQRCLGIGSKREKIFTRPGTQTRDIGGPDAEIIGSGGMEISGEMKL